MSELFGIPVDTILTGKGIKARTEEIEVAKTNKYDFYNTSTANDLRAHPELIREHFEYLQAHPEKYTEIPRKYGKWNIAKVLENNDLIISSSSLDRVRETRLKLKELNGLKYVFSINGTILFSTISGTKRRDYALGDLLLQIEFDNRKA